MALGLPHINNGQVVLQFKELFKRLIRRYGRPNLVHDNTNVHATGQASRQNEVTIVMDDTYTPNLRLTYIRLPSFRAMPQSVALAVTRREIRRAQGTRATGAFGDFEFSGQLFNKGDTKIMGLRCGSDVSKTSSALTVRAPSRTVGSYKDVEWTGVQFPQPPSYIFITYEKDPEYMSYDNPIAPDLRKIGLQTNAATVAAKFSKVAADNTLPAATDDWNTAFAQGIGPVTAAQIQADEIAARYIAQSQDANAAILQAEIIIQSAIGSFAFRDSKDDKCFLSDRDLMWRTHVRNCHSQYCKSGRGAWQDRKSCLLLSSSDYLLGLSTSPGTVFPITLDVRIRFANRAAYRGGLCYTMGKHKGQAEFEDFLVGEPIMVGIFTQNVLSLAASSAVYSSQAFSQATTSAALAS